MSTFSQSSSEVSIKRVFTNNYVYPDWFTETDYKFYTRMLKQLKKNIYFHTRAAEHFNKMQYYIFGPSIIITAVSGVASFLSTSSIIGEELQNGFGISVGVLASISTMLQSVGSSCKFSAKADAHRLAAEEYSKLMTRLKFEMEKPDEESFIGDMEAQIIDIKNKCNYFVPQFIIDNYYKSKNKLQGKSDLVEMLNNIPDKINNIKSVSDSNIKDYQTFKNDNIAITITEEEPTIDISNTNLLDISYNENGPQEHIV